MPLNFDDIVPQGGAAPAQTAQPPIQAAPSGGRLNFDDIVPQKSAPAGYGGKSPPPENSWAGSLKALSAGLGEGAIGLAGLPGDLGNLGAQGIDAATRFTQRSLGLPESAPYDPSQPTLSGHRLPGAAKIQSKVEDLTGPFYQPQTAMEQGLNTIGQFAPAAIGGPENLALKLGTRVVAPALASEAAGEATKGTAAEPFARFGGAVLGGGLAGGLGRGLQAAPKPSAAQMDAAITAGYNDPAIKNLQLAPQAGSDIADQIEQRLKAAKVDKFNGGVALTAADRLRTPRFGPNLTIDDLEAARQDAQANPVTASPAERRAGPIVKSVIDDYLNGNIPQSHVLVGNADAANAALVDARGNFAANARATDVSNALQRAENQSASTNSGHNLDNATRQQLRPILNDKQGVSKTPAFQDYTPDEIAALQKSVNGNWLRNSVRDVGKQLGSGGGLGNISAGIAGAGAAHESGMDPMTSILMGIGAMAGGRALGGLANRMTANEAEQMAAMLRARSPLGNQMAAAHANSPMLGFNVNPQAILQAMAASHPRRITIPLGQRLQSQN